MHTINHQASTLPQQMEPKTGSLPLPSWFDIPYEERCSPSSLDMTAKVSNLSSVEKRLEGPLELSRCYVQSSRNLDEAENSCRRIVEWRQEIGIHSLCLADINTPESQSIPTPLFLHYFPSCFLEGIDLEGDPIWWDRTGALTSMFS